MTQEHKMLKNGIKVFTKNKLHYIVNDNGRLLKFKPWLGDAFSFLYDSIMTNSIFPKKFGGDIALHFQIFKKELKDFHNKRILELATGSGSAVNFLPNDNLYTGIDISPGLLKKAAKYFSDFGFHNAEFYVTSANELPFENDLFDIILCILSLNFFVEINKVFQEMKRVATKNATFICSVPVPERNRLKSTIRGFLYSEQELEKMCQENGFHFEKIQVENGALLYYRAVLP